jgi:hypothetical protein
MASTPIADPFHVNLLLFQACCKVGFLLISMADRDRAIAYSQPTEERTAFVHSCVSSLLPPGECSHLLSFLPSDYYTTASFTSADLGATIERFETHLNLLPHLAGILHEIYNESGMTWDEKEAAAATVVTFAPEYINAEDNSPLDNTSRHIIDILHEIQETPLCRTEKEAAALAVMSSVPHFMIYGDGGVWEAYGKIMEANQKDHN